MSVGVRARLALVLLLFTQEASAHSFEGWLPIAGAAFTAHLSPMLVLWGRVGWLRKLIYVALFPMVFLAGVALAASLRVGAWPVYVVCLAPAVLAWLYWAWTIRRTQRP